MLGALLDRSLAQIADAAADARRYDRETIRAVSDVWDDNTYPLFHAATAGRRGERERRALAALEWMADFGTKRRAWMLEQASTAGHALEDLLPVAKANGPGRDHRGHVMAPVTAMTPESAAGLAADYDLPTVEVRYLLVERAGSTLTGHLRLAAAPTCRVGDGTSPAPAVLHIWLRDVAEVRFDSYDARGAALRTEADGVSIAIGAHGTLRAAAADLYPDDREWHLSASGRRADATTPPRDVDAPHSAPPQRGRLGTNAAIAADILFNAMIEIRGVRHAVPPRPGTAEHGPWCLRVLTRPAPTRFQLRTEAFQGAGRPRDTVDEVGARHFVLHDGALDITNGKEPDHDPR